MRGEGGRYVCEGGSGSVEGVGGGICVAQRNMRVKGVWGGYVRAYWCESVCQGIGTLEETYYIAICNHGSLEEEEGEDGNGETDEGDGDTDDPNDPQGDCLSRGQLGREGGREGGS